MPVEYTNLKHRPSPFQWCPKCRIGYFQPFMRGQVQSWWRKLLRLPYCCVICSKCKEIVGHEDGR